LVPAANVRHLILRKDVVQAVAEGRFHIYPVHTIDEGLSILTGVRADAPDGVAGFNETVSQRLRELAVGLKEFVAGERNGAAESKP
jgi:predicted ATP-dependent protease